MDHRLIKIFNPVITISRSKGYKAPGGLRYPGGIVYYPRNPDHKDPEYTPTKLFRVERIRPVKHNPWRLKLILKNLKIDEENRVTVVKNIPEMNSILWKIKHLIKITPITFPHGEPTLDDINHTILKENGQCIVIKSLAPCSNQIEALEKFDSDKTKMDSTTIKRDSRYKWNNAYGGGF